LKYADALERNRTERLMGSGTPAIGQLLFLIAAACSLSFHTPDADVCVGSTGVLRMIFPEYWVIVFPQRALLMLNGFSAKAAKMYV
jgi:hypothetical protein